ncbi:Cyclic nucleotide-binding domain [Phytophthora infestans]|uniref:Cyclic nucleotide-binding domain n=1 Tax=Phytophthora infestans TaxID=4787 RepID=A0A833SZZ8_PHYIN|nr:Cyclic nucleotide-binding domain [Phytophthora infestans]KAF4144781.1 Cyclic nucleotide-binding domain [Phytophthora infestans]
MDAKLEDESSPRYDSEGRKRNSLDQAKQLVRKSSAQLLHILDTSKPSPTEMNLDLDAFYYSRLRRRTQFAQQISNTLTAAGVPTDSAAAGAAEASSPSKKRGIGMTLSPGEEYENYQKVQATMLGDDGLFITEDGMGMVHQEEEEEDDDEEEEKRASHNEKVLPLNQLTGDATDREELRKAAGITIKKTQKRRSALTERTIRGKEDLTRPTARMIDPLGRFRLFWDLTSISFIFYNAIVLPFKATFDVEAKDNPFETVLDVFFLIDIILTFNTAIEKEGSIRYNRRLVAETYLKSWFLVDLIAALPYGYIFTEDGHYSATLRKSVKLLRLIRLLRLLRISRILRRIQNAVFIRSTLSSLMKYCLMVIFINHWFSCIFHAIGSSNIEESWIRAQGLEEPDANKWDRYVAALYFSVQTLSTIGFGDVASQSAHERLFCVLAMIVGGGIFAYGITNIVELVSSLTIQETVFRQKLDEVNEYMSARELPIKLRMEIREFYHNTRQSRESKLNSEQQILNDLSSKLRSKIALSINDQFLRKFPFFTGSEPNFLMELALNMRVIHFAPLEDAIIEGEIGHEMFFIFRGAVEVVKKNVRIGILGENQYFGEMAILSPDNRRTATVRTLCFCELRMLSRARFLEALALFPAMQAKMAQIAQGRAAAVNFDPINEKQKQKSGHFSGNNLMTAAAAFSLSPPLKPEQKSFKAANPHLATTANGNAVAPTPPSTIAPRSPTFARHLSAARLPLEQRPSERLATHIRAPTSVRINSNVRRSSGNVGSVGISPVMSIMIGEITSLLEEATRRQDLLMTQVRTLKEDVDRIRMPVTDMDERRNTNEDLSDIFEKNNK